MDNETGVHLDNGILLGNQKEQTTHTCDKADESQMGVAEVKEGRHHDYFICMTLWKKQTNRNRK